MKNPFKKADKKPEPPTLRPVADVVAEVQTMSVGLVHRLRLINKLNREAQAISAKLDQLDAELEAIKAASKDDNAQNNPPAQKQP